MYTILPCNRCLTQFGRPLHSLPRQFISRPTHLTQPAQSPQLGDHLFVPKMAVMLEFRLPRERDPSRVHDNPCRHSKHAVMLDLAGFFLLGQCVDGGVLGLVTRTARLDGVVGAADKELVHYSRGWPTWSVFFFFFFIFFLSR